MKAMRIAVVAGVLVGVVGATVHAGLFSANVTGKQTRLDNTTELVTSKSFSSKTIISGATDSTTAKLVLDSDTGAVEVVDECGNLIATVLTEVGIGTTVGPDANSNSVSLVLVSLNGTGDTNGTAIVTISDKTTFKESVVFQISDNSGSGKVTTGKITTSSAFKPASTCAP